jgi:hypothetical protein
LSDSDSEELRTLEDIEDLRTQVKNFYDSYWSSDEEDRPIEIVIKGTRIDREKLFKRKRMEANIQRLLETLTRQQAEAQRPKPASPTSFSGKREENIRQWFKKLDNYFECCGTVEGHKANYLLSLLRGEAFEIAKKEDARIRALTDNDGNPLNRPATYNELRTALTNYFLSHAHKEVIRNQLDDRKLKKNENIEDYIAEVLDRAGQLEYTEEDKMRVIQRGLPMSLKSEVMAFQPATLEQLINRIRLSDTIDRMRRDEKGVSARSVTVDSEPEVSLTMLSAVRDLQEEVSRLKTGQEPVEKKEQSQNKLPRRCWFCMDPNHIFKQCEKRKKWLAKQRSFKSKPQDSGSDQGKPMKVMLVNSQPPASQPATAYLYTQPPANSATELN